MEPTKHRPAIAIGRVYRFGKELDGNACLTSGWGEPESGFVWSEGKASLVTMPAVPGKNILAITLWGYVPDGARAQEVLIFVNGSLKGYFDVFEKTTLRVSDDNVAGAQTLELLFYIPSATSPSQAEGSTDERRLGIALSTVKVSNDSRQ